MVGYLYTLMALIGTLAAAGGVLCFYGVTADKRPPFLDHVEPVTAALLVAGIACGWMLISIQP